MVVHQGLDGHASLDESGPMQRQAKSPSVIGELRQVEFDYPSGIHVLDGISLSLVEGRSIGVIGPSGCGKSTMLAVVAGLVQATSGEIWWAPDVSHRHRLSMVFQKDTLLPWLTVEDNVMLWRRFNRRSESPGIDLDRLLDLGGLQSCRKQYPYQLSGGMRRRTAVLTAVAPKPRMLLLDEPFSSLDEPTRIGIHQDVHQMLREYETSMVLVTHDLAEAISLCDEIVILSNRPAEIVGHHVISFGHERNMLELRKEPTFLELYGALWDELSQQIAKSSSNDD
jgi:NitT/TauT family transport system ATP-binding protein